MSGPEYPPPSYTGSAGEASAWVRGAGTPPELPMGGGSAAHYLATGQTTGGAFGLYKWDMGPRPSCSRMVPLSTKNDSVMLRWKCGDGPDGYGPMSHRYSPKAPPVVCPVAR